MKLYLIVILLLCLVISYVPAQITIPREIRSDSTVHTSSLMASNSVTYMDVSDGVLWLGTGNGLSRTTDFGNTWENYNTNSAFANPGIFSLTVCGNSIWTSTGYDFATSDGGTVQTGSGYTYSIDGGRSWDHLKQTLDTRGDSILSYGVNDSVWILPIVVPQQNVTFDISVSPSYVWIASWSSGLRRTSNNGQTWERILLPLDNRNSLTPDDSLWTFDPTDTLGLHKIWARYDPRNNNNMLAFSVFTQSYDTVWCGTAGGVNVSIDGGQSWDRYTHQNELRPILGNWVIAIDGQHVNGINRIWTTNWKANDPSEDYGISYTEDNGRSWKNILQGVKAYGFAFKDSIVYIASDNGLYRTGDLGNTLQVFSSFSDSAPRIYIPPKKVYSVSVVDDTVFVGTEDGLVKTIDNATNKFGSSWDIYRTYQKVGTTKATYAYPNPYSPASDQIVRIHYGAETKSGSGSRSVSIEIFDFGMNRVRTLITKAMRDLTREYDEVWDGRDNSGNTVPNGVYFYRLVINDGDPAFGKILVMQ